MSLSSSPRPHGACAIVLHTHLPFVHHPEYEDFLEEEWLFEAISECYLPLIELLRRRTESSLGWKLSLSLTPPLLSMLGIERLQEKYVRFEKARLKLALQLLDEFTADEDPRQAAAAHYVERLEGNLKLFDSLNRNLIEAFSKLSSGGSLEILGSAATHGYLPLLQNDQARMAQIKVGLDLHEELLGARPRGFWLPECAYKPGIDRQLIAAGLEWVVLESHAIAGANPEPGLQGPGGILTESGLACFGRDRESSSRVWSNQTGYPGDPAYRELYRDIGFDAPYRDIRPYLKPDGIRRNIGLKFNAVTGDVPLHEKDIWRPDAARARATLHGADFMRFQTEQLSRMATDNGAATPLLLCPYDTELFGHWWYEGSWFLESVFDAASTAEGAGLTTPGAFLDTHTPTAIAQPLESSWGEDGCHKVWLNETNQHFWRYLHEMENRMIQAANLHQAPTSLQRRLLDQMARELLLAQSSDWLFILTMGTSSHYAERRFRDHVHRFFALEDSLTQPAETVDLNDLKRVEAEDSIFPSLSYTAFSTA